MTSNINCLFLNSMFLLFSLFTTISYFQLALVTVEISLKVQEQLADMDIDSPGCTAFSTIN